MTVRHVSRRPLADYKEDMHQNWIKNSPEPGCYSDQYGFKIQSTPADVKLYRHGKLLIEVLSVMAAKEISRIVLNDRILNISVE